MNRRDGRRLPVHLAVGALATTAVLAVGCGGGGHDDHHAIKAKPGPAPDRAAEAKKQQADPKEVLERAKAVFGTPPPVAKPTKYELSEAKIDLGRHLYYDPRLSKNHDISCNSCHDLANYGVDNEKTSPGHKGQRGERNSPSVYYAAFHMAQFWDGRAMDVEEQAQGPVVNPVEMAMVSEEHVEKTLASIPEYQAKFEAAFGPDAITFANMAQAIGAFERKLVTPSPFDDFLAGDLEALTAEQVRGLDIFMKTGCTTCHTGATIGGSMYQKLGVTKPYPTKDVGRFAVTKVESDKRVFKVPSLRNVAKTGPYLHDGSIASLPEMVKLMSEYQLATEPLDEDETKAVVAFLESLTGEIPEDYIQKPELPESGPDTPPADAS